MTHAQQSIINQCVVTISLPYSARAKHNRSNTTFHNQFHSHSGIITLYLNVHVCMNGIRYGLPCKCVSVFCCCCWYEPKYRNIFMFLFIRSQLFFIFRRRTHASFIGESLRSSVYVILFRFTYSKLCFIIPTRRRDHPSVKVICASALCIFFYEKNISFK